MLVTPNFDQISDTVGEGIYRARVIDSKIDTWAGKDGKPSTTFIAWTLETFSEAEEKNNGRRIFHRTPIEGKGAFRLQEFFKAAMHEECSGAFDPSALHGKEIEVTVAQQRNNPQYFEVAAVRPIKH
jgi:hypothetical protein